MEVMRKKTIFAMSMMVLMIGCCLCGCSKKQEESHRLIQVLETSGTVTVERSEIGTVEAYEGMRLQSGDFISVESESWLKLQMDEDKYALVEPSSKLRLEAAGNSTDSQTVIHLEAGAISNRLESELSDASVYEVNTPNSTMAVRGTVFRVEVFFDENGVSNTNVSVYDGKVASRLIYPDGTVEDENKAVLIIDGTGVQIWGNDTTSDYVNTNNKNDLKKLQLETLYFLQESYETNADLNISREELKELIAQLEENRNPKETETESTEEMTEVESTEEESEPEEPESAGTSTQPEVPESTEAETYPVIPESTGAETQSSEPESVDQGAGSTGNSSGQGSSSGSGGSSGTGNSGGNTGGTNQPSVAQYTVTFMYNGSVFATQTVQQNATATVPKLQPTASGSWSSNLSEPVSGNTTITWTAS